MRKSQDAKVKDKEIINNEVKETCFEKHHSLAGQAFIFIFCFFSPINGPSKVQNTIYYTIVGSENFYLWFLWYWWGTCNSSMWFYWIGLIIAPLFFVLGLFSMVSFILAFLINQYTYFVININV